VTTLFLMLSATSRHFSPLSPVELALGSPDFVSSIMSDLKQALQEVATDVES